MTATIDPRIGVLCVDDSAEITAVLRRLIDTEPDMRCVGVLHSAERLLEEIAGASPPPGVVLLDLTMPGPDPLDASREAAARYPDSRILAFSGHDDAGTSDRVIDAGGWGLVSKHGPHSEILRAIREVAGGRVYFSGWDKE